MRITDRGQVQCENCGCDRFREPQMRANDHNEVDVFICCANCSTPLYTGLTVPESETELLSSLGQFFDRRPEGE